MGSDDGHGGGLALPNHVLRAGLDGARRFVDGGDAGISAEATHWATVTKHIPSDLAKLDLSFEMNKAPDCTAFSGQAIGFVTLTAPGQNIVGLLMTPSGMMVLTKNGAESEQYSELVPIPNTVLWTTVTMKAAGGKLLVTFNGAAASAPIPYPVMGTKFDLEVGVKPQNLSTCAAAYDNIVVH